MTIKPLILPLFDPLAIHGYGIAIAIAIIVFAYLSYKHVKQSIDISFDTVSNIVIGCIVAGVIGGRILHVISEWSHYTHVTDMFAVWSGGLSILGCIAAVSLYLPYALWKNSIPIAIALDSAALYAPIAQAIGRFGCLWAGCCFGCVTSVPWAISYEGHTAGAPLGVMLHPTQLYSALCCVILFCILRYAIPAKAKKPGLIAVCYLIGVGIERFAVDFMRSDRIFLTQSFFSLHQWIALAIIGGSLIFLLVWHHIQKHTQSDSAKKPNISL